VANADLFVGAVNTKGSQGWLAVIGVVLLHCRTEISPTCITSVFNVKLLFIFISEGNTSSSDNSDYGFFSFTLNDIQISPS
jgi:hypothetical protein